jgi:4-hydroxybenzoate polyprenyltransferase
MVAAKSLKALDYVFVLRPVLFVPGWSTVLAGSLILSKNQLFYDYQQFSTVDWGGLFYILFLFALAMGATFLLNQLKDVETDLKNNKLFFLSEKHISRKAALIEVIVLLTVSLMMALMVNIRVFFSVFVFIIVTGYLYNFTPFSLKDKPWGSVVANAAMGWLAFATGWYSVQSNSGNILMDSLPYLFFNTALYFFTLLPDIPGDKKFNKKTLAVLKGEGYVINISFYCYLISLYSAIVLNDYFALIFILPSLPFFIVTVIKKKVKPAIISTKYAISFFALAVCLKLPFYFLLIIAVFIFTKWFFRSRFNFNYPNFKGV